MSRIKELVSVGVLQVTTFAVVVHAIVGHLVSAWIHTCVAVVAVVTTAVGVHIGVLIVGDLFDLFFAVVVD